MHHEPATHSAADHRREVSSFYDEMWRSYGRLDALSPAAFHRRRLLLALAAKDVPRAILDVGCGRGELLSQLGQRFPAARISGSDVSPQSLADTHRAVPRADVFELDLAEPDFDRTHVDRLGTFDLVVCSEVLEHLVDDLSAAERLRSLLVPGGRLLVTVPGGRPSRFDLLIGHQRHYRCRDLCQLLGRAGLDVSEAMAWGFPFHTVYRTAVRGASRLALSRPAHHGAAGRLSRPLAAAYGLFARALKPLYYLNLSRFGEQIIAAANRPRATRRGCSPPTKP